MRRGSFEIRAFEQYGKLLAAEPADDAVLARRFTADGTQNLISHIVPVAVVDALEMVDVKHDRGKGRRWLA